MSKWLEKFNLAEKFNDMRSLRDLCKDDEQFKRLRQEFTNSHNASRRDVMNKYHATDYMGLNDSDLASIGLVPVPAQSARHSDARALGEGVRVSFGAHGHVCDGKTGTIVQTRPGQYLVELDITHRPDRKGNVTGKRVQLWAESMYLSVRG